MEENLFEHKFGDSVEDLKLKSFVVDTVPETNDMVNIKKKTYAKIKRDKERRMRRRRIAAGLMLAAGIALLVSVVAVPWSSLRDVSEHVLAKVRPRTLTVTVPVGEARTYILPDGTRLVANSRSTVKYPEKFTDDTRDIYIRGEVYLEVAHDEEHPFIVHTDGFDLKVLGTKFNIMNYDGRHAGVVLVQGAVEVTTGNRDKVTMRPNQLVNVTDGKLDGLRTVDTSQYTSWMKGVMDLHGDDIHQVINRLNDYYGTEIGVHGDVDVTPLYGKLVYKKDVDDVLNTINRITGTKVTVMNGKVYLTK